MKRLRSLHASDDALKHGVTQQKGAKKVHYFLRR